ncbi:MAG: ribosome maturation factor RimP [Proteobacteria bacterium]|nr:MAG: ribosome maturation factor RimP [Pseudomonadota bacterium]
MRKTNSELSTTATTTTENQAPATSVLTEHLEALMKPILEVMGYEVVHLELETGRQRILRLFIDWLDPAKGGIGVEDCVKVSRALDEPLEAASPDPVLNSWLKTEYEFEVSSPGIDRPLRKEKDFLRFIGRETRLSTLRPLSSDELKNETYASRNPKQKNFIGEIAGFEGGSILLKVFANMGSAKSLTQPKKGVKKPKVAAAPVADLIHLPLSLVAKANLEPDFDIIDDENDDESENP